MSTNTTEICSSNLPSPTLASWDNLYVPFYVTLGLSVLLLIIFEIFVRVENTSFLYDGRNRKRLKKFRNRTPALPKGPLAWLMIKVNEAGGVVRCSVADLFYDSWWSFIAYFNVLLMGRSKHAPPPPPSELNSSEMRFSLRDSTRTTSLFETNRFSFSEEKTRSLSPKEAELLRLIGLDSYAFLRYLRFGFNVSFYPFVIAAAVLFPVYATEPNPPSNFVDINPFASITVQNLPERSGRMWAATVMSMLFYAYALRVLWVEWEYFVSLRLHFLCRGDEHGNKFEAMAFRKTVLVERIGGASGTELKETFELLFPNQISAVYIVPETSKLDLLISERLAILKRFENLVAKRKYHDKRKRYFMETWDGKSVRINPKREPARFGRFMTSPSMGELSKSNNTTVCDTDKVLEIYLKAIDTLNREIEEQANTVEASPSPLDAAFVKFRSAPSRQICLSVTLFNGNRISISEAPEPSDIIWTNFGQTKMAVYRTKVLFSLVLYAGLLLVISFAFFVSAFVNVEQLQCFEWIHITPPAPNTFARQLFTSLIPPIMWIIFMSLVYVLIKLGGRYLIRFRTFTAINAYTFKFFFLYQLVGFVFVIIGGTISATWAKLVSDPSSLLANAAKSLIDQALFFLTYAVLRISKNFLDLSLLLPLLKKLFIRAKRSKEGSSQRKLNSYMYPEGLNINRMLPMMSFLITISISYVVMIPIASLFIAASMWISCKTYKYLTIFVTGKKFEGGGRVIFQGLQQLPIIFLVCQLLFVVYLVVAKSYWCAVSFSGVPVATLITYFEIRRQFVTVAKVMTLAAATSFQMEEERALLRGKDLDDDADDTTANESSESSVTLEGDVDSCYISPGLRRHEWELEPLPYRTKGLHGQRAAYARKDGLYAQEHTKFSHLATPGKADEEREMENNKQGV